MMAPRVVMTAAHHEFGRKDIPMNKQGSKESTIVIVNDVWIGFGAMFFADVNIGR